VQLRRYISPDTEFFQTEVKRLHEAGVIRPSISAWRAQPLVVTNSETGQGRLCIDLAKTINLYTVLEVYPLPRIEDMVRRPVKYFVFPNFDLKGAYHLLELEESDKPFTALSLQVVCGNAIVFHLVSLMGSCLSKHDGRNS